MLYLFWGLVPTLVQIFPYAGLQFGFYAFFKTLWEMSIRIKVCFNHIQVGTCIYTTKNATNAEWNNRNL